MKKNATNYSSYKRMSKRILQVAFRLCIYGALLLAGEVAFYTITKVGRQIPLLNVLFQYKWLVDPKLKLGQIWEIGISTFYGQASLYMFFVYGLICVCGLEPAYRWMKRKDVPFLVRAIFYMFIILGMECLLGWILYWITGYQIWYYEGWGSFPVYTSFAIAPMWFICGLITENVINIFHSFNNTKMMLYGLATFAGAKKENGNRIAVLSDVHVGKQNASSAWFKGIYPAYLNIILYKIALDSRISHLVILGDFFDTWLCPISEHPYKNVSDVIDAWKNVSDVIDAWKNAPFMEPLIKCIEQCKDVWYIPGNHDMGITQDDLKKVYYNEESGKYIKLKTSGDYDTSTFFPSQDSQKYVLHFEHGHESDLFNAPVEAGTIDSIQNLPFGYFVTRLAASTDENNLTKIFKKAYGQAFNGVTIPSSKALHAVKNSDALPVLTADENSDIGKRFIHLFVDILVAMRNAKDKNDEKIDDTTVIKMAAPYTDVTVGDIKNAYHSLLPRYFQLNREPLNPDNPSAFHKYYILAAAKSGQRKVARSQFGKTSFKFWIQHLFSRQNFEKVVIMGHTHKTDIQYVMNAETVGVYANTGCICNSSKTPSWIEIIRTEKRGYRIRINKL